MRDTFRAKLTHAGIRVTEMAPMRRFYEQVCGLLVSDADTSAKTGIEYCFMTADAGSHHQVVLASGRPKEATFSTVFQLSFRLASLAQLREAEHRAREAGAGNIRPLSHGNAWSVYLDDPEGNTLEFYVDTPWYVAQPFGDPLDLSLADAEIERLTEARCRAYPGFMEAAQWARQMAQRLATPVSADQTQPQQDAQ